MKPASKDVDYLTGAVEGLVAEARKRARQELQELNVHVADTEGAERRSEKVMVTNCGACEVKY